MTSFFEFALALAIPGALLIFFVPPDCLPQHMTGERRFPPPWTVERAAANLMTKDEARKIAGGIAKLPELLTREAK